MHLASSRRPAMAIQLYSAIHYTATLYSAIQYTCYTYHPSLFTTPLRHLAVIESFESSEHACMKDEAFKCQVSRM